MEERSGPVDPGNPHPAAAALVLVAMVLGCVALWVVVPLGGLWLAGEITDSAAVHPLMAISLILPGIFVLSLLLAWLNDQYVRLSGPIGELRGGVFIRRRGPLELILAVCFVIAVVAFLLWFFLLAQNPGRVFGP